MAATTTRTLADRCGAVRRMIGAMVRDPTEWEPEDLQRIVRLRVQLDAALTEAVLATRENGATDAEIGEALGITRAAVSKRWPGGGRYVGAAGRYRTHTQKENHS